MVSWKNVIDKIQSGEIRAWLKSSYPLYKTGKKKKKKKKWARIGARAGGKGPAVDAAPADRAFIPQIGQFQ